MAVQKSKKSRSKRNKKRSANSIFKAPSLSLDNLTGETHIRHFITKTGYYKGKQVFKFKKSLKKNKEN